MKTAIYIEDGVVQLVITPENEFEKNAMAMFKNRPLDAKLFEGEFYDCRGGWIRQKQYYSSHFDSDNRDNSLILRIDESKAEEEA